MDDRCQSKLIDNLSLDSQKIVIVGMIYTSELNDAYKIVL